MRRRPPAMQATIDKLLAEGWLITDELPLLRVVTLARITIGMDGIRRAEYMTVGRAGRTRTNGDEHHE